MNVLATHTRDHLKTVVRAASEAMDLIWLEISLEIKNYLRKKTINLIEGLNLCFDQRTLFLPVFYSQIKIISNKNDQAWAFNNSYKYIELFTEVKVYPLFYIIQVANYLNRYKLV